MLAGAALNGLRAMACACAPHGRVDLVVALLRCTTWMHPKLPSTSRLDRDLQPAVREVLYCVVWVGGSTNPIPPNQAALTSYGRVPLAGRPQHRQAERLSHLLRDRVVHRHREALRRERRLHS